MSVFITTEHKPKKSTIYTDNCEQCKLCTECKDCVKCTKCIDCKNCHYCIECTGCKNCIRCKGLINESNKVGIVIEPKSQKSELEQNVWDIVGEIRRNLG